MNEQWEPVGIAYGDSGQRRWRQKQPSSDSSPSAGSARRIFVHPGHVVSRTDGDLHFIPAGRLAELYGVRLRDCIVVDKHDPQNHQHGYKNRDGDIHLYPRRDGDYRRVPN